MPDSGRSGGRVFVGAEAVVELGERVRKRRVKKNYRHPKIDSRLRKRRTKSEAKILEDAKRAGVNVPRVFEKKGFELEMERVEGERLKSMEKIPEEVCEMIGKQLGLLHSAGIAHLDLTTSNMILAGGKLYFIDFGLSSYGKTEDFGVDLHLLRRALMAAHKKPEKSFKAVLKGYKKIFDGAEEAIERERKIDKRGRYK